MTYRRRIVDDELDDLLTELPAIALEGPRGVGKTATAERRATTSFYLDDPAQRAVVEADPARVVRAPPPVLIDEWQLVPEVWDAVRRAVDRGAPPGSFLLTGSAAPSGPPTHTGAGRIVTVRMRPMALAERTLATPTVSLSAFLKGTKPDIGGSTDVGLVNYTAEIVRSGFPGLRTLSDRARRRQIDGYIARIIDTDFVEQGHPVRRVETLSSWLRAYAAATSSTASYETLRDGATGGHGDKPARSTTLPYRDVLERLWIVDPVRPWSPSRNPFSRLGSAAKHQLADPALAARILGLDAGALLAGDVNTPPVPREGPLIGGLFEALVALSIRVYAQAAEARVSHMRLHGGDREIDLIVERGDGKIVAIESKLGRSVDDADARHLHWLRDQIGSDLLDAVIVTSGSDAYRRSDGVAVVPAVLLGP